MRGIQFNVLNLKKNNNNFEKKYSKYRRIRNITQVWKLTAKHINYNSGLMSGLAHTKRISLSRENSIFSALCTKIHLYRALTSISYCYWQFVWPIWKFSARKNRESIAKPYLCNILYYCVISRYLF